MSSQSDAVSEAKVLLKLVLGCGSAIVILAGLVIFLFATNPKEHAAPPEPVQSAPTAPATALPEPRAIDPSNRRGPAPLVPQRLSNTYRVSRSELGKQWPFRVADGVLECRKGALLFTSNGSTYSLQGTALGYPNVEPVLKKIPPPPNRGGPSLALMVYLAGELCTRDLEAEDLANGHR